MIYLDNAATTHIKPLCVKVAFWRGITKYSANPGRSGHTLSYNAGMQVLKTRQTLQSFFGAQNISNVLFTSGCTEALNLAILGTAKNLAGISLPL